VSAATAKRGLGQRAGIANTLMGAVRGEQDGRSKKVNFNLSKQQVAQIFAERPAVRKAYLKHVLPNGNLTDLQFWTKYCRVEYLKQSRKGVPFTSEQDDADAALFAEDEADLKAAKAPLQWAVDKAKDPEHALLARVRLAGILLDEKAYDEGLKLLSVTDAGVFEGLFADRRGDLLVAQGKVSEARAAYQLSLQKLETNSALRPIVQLKLDAIGGA
jgi:hypothetical protein